MDIATAKKQKDLLPTAIHRGIQYLKYTLNNIKVLICDRRGDFAAFTKGQFPFC